MAKVTLRKYVPIPAGVYNMKVLSYEKKESSKTKGSFYYQWKIQITDPLPEEYLASSNGSDTFSVLTATNLTEKNNLRKFLNRVGFTEIEVGQEVELDTVLNCKFVSKVIVKDGTDGNKNNDLADPLPPELIRFLDREKAAPVKATARQMVQRPPVQRQSASASAPEPEPEAEAEAEVEAPAPAPARPAARPAARPVAPAARPAARPVAPAARPATRQVTPQPVVEEEAGGGDGTEEFPEQA